MHAGECYAVSKKMEAEQGGTYSPICRKFKSAPYAGRGIEKSRNKQGSIAGGSEEENLSSYKIMCTKNFFKLTN